MRRADQELTCASAANDASTAGCVWTPMTLMEVLVALTIGGLLLAGATQLTATAWSATNRAIREAHELRELGLLARRWRRTVYGTSGGEWIVTPQSFTSGNVQVRFENGELLLSQTRDGRSRRKRLLIPRRATVRFSRESPPGQSEMAVLWLEWHTARRKTAQTVRIVACRQATSDGDHEGP